MHPGEADKKEFRQIAGKDRLELHPLQQGVGFPLGLFEDPSIKGKPLQLPIEEPPRVPSSGLASLLPVLFSLRIVLRRLHGLFRPPFLS
ncbi:MAG: hypothetical protein BWY88_01080 [Synergistetes bacterium ADurb.Bin520]|nr:MAG: hypothetical protein BWY88_01080 [Synergistetes bacterium ADurb.Bin520]